MGCNRDLRFGERPNLLLCTIDGDCVGNTVDSPLSFNKLGLIFRGLRGFLGLCSVFFAIEAKLHRVYLVLDKGDLVRVVLGQVEILFLLYRPKDFGIVTQLPFGDRKGGADVLLYIGFGLR